MSISAAVDLDLLGRIKTLSEQIWEGRCREPEVRRWLNNFDGSALGDAQREQTHALHLLSHMTYFGLRELRVLLRSMYRDFFRYPLLQDARQSLGDTRDLAAVQTMYENELNNTRFLGMGNPAESGTHLLYYFRQENALPKELFVHHHGLITGPITDPHSRISPPTLKRLVFIDDICGSGQQAVEYSQGLLKDLQDVAGRDGRTLEFHYLVLLGTESGLERVKTQTAFNSPNAVSLIDDSYKTFASGSRVYMEPPAGIDQATGESVARHYGLRLWPPHPLGYGDRQLLMAFHHNVPDNTLPIIWHDADHSWHPIFPRYHKA
ncbi:MAG: hypothetical protein R2702_06625 [Acidimicrobiales bacterium]